MNNQSADNLMQRYVEICNSALDQNKDRFPFKQILGTAKTCSANRLIEVLIEGTARNEDSHVLTIEDGKLVCRAHSACGNCQCDGKWVIGKAYLQNVLARPDSYIENPARLNWEWLLPSA